jgi:hypothetical protein
MPSRKQHAQEEAACPGGAAKLGGSSMPRGSGIKRLYIASFHESKISLFLASNLKMRVYEAPISTIRGVADFFFANMRSYFSNYLQIHGRMLCRALLCCSP